ncbi:MAG: hypothetical protein NT062_04775 [Proteobacteria bacterium]|nr:hypothetical protein [Pseudomonadota bacterium]
MSMRLTLITLSGLLWLDTSASAEIARQQRPTPAPKPSQRGPRSQDQLDPFMGDPGPPRPQPPTPVKPAPEITTVGKTLAGMWTCKGVALNGDGSSTPVIGAMVTRLDLDNAWIATTTTEKAGRKLSEFRTFDAVAKQWTRIQMTSTSAYIVTTSLGEKAGLWTWTGAQTSPTGTLQVRDFEQRTGKTVKLWGDVQLGGAWQKLYDMSCTK